MHTRAAVREFAVLLLVFWSPRPDFQEVYLSVALHGSIASRALYMPVWTVNPDYPVNPEGSLTVCGHSLCLLDGNGTTAWMSGASHISALTLQSSGDLVMFGASGSILWQSLQHPEDKLVPNQRLTPGMSLWSNPTVYSATMYPGGIVVTRNVALSKPIPVRIISFTSTFSTNFTEVLLPPCSKLGIESAAVLVSNYNSNYSSFTLQASCRELRIPITFPADSPPPYFVAADYMSLLPDGELRAYRVQDYENEVLEGYLQLNSLDTTSLSDCLNPESCGLYGICTPLRSDKQNKSCACPDNSNSSGSSEIFLGVDPKNASRGCKLSIPLQCNTYATQHQDLLEYKNVTLVSMLIKGWNNNKRPLPECQALCKSNCSCAAVFYDYNSSTCLLIPIGYVFTMINVSDSSYSAFLKVPTYDQLQPASVIVNTSGNANPGKSHSTQHNRKFLVPAILGSFAFLVVCACLAVYSFYMLRMSASYREEEELHEKEIQAIAEALPRRFSLRELETATSEFSRKLGKGGSGSVYEGILEGGRRVAVKKLDSEIQQGHKQFLAEVVVMGRISHMNIVRLLGFCSERSKKLLVFEYMENGSLDNWIYGGVNEKPPYKNMLSWSQRFAVVIGTVQGLIYLHDECTKPILHLDIKPHNVLLDASFVAKVADFGLSRPTDREASLVMTGVRGTPGYIAPEWQHLGASRKCDVFSFGMVLLEIVGGRRIECESRMASLSEEKDWTWHLPSWAVDMVAKGRIGELVDRRLEGVYDMEQVTRAVLVALWCIQADPKARPEMAQVMKMLEGTLDIAMPPPPPQLGL